MRLCNVEYMRQFYANFYHDKNDNFSSFFSDLKLGIFLQKLGKKDTFWHWEYNPITAIKSAKNKP